MIVTLLEVAGSLPGNTGSKAIQWNLQESAAEGMEELDKVYSTDSLEQFLASRPETGSPQCFYLFKVRTQEETGSTRRL